MYVASQPTVSPRLSLGVNDPTQGSWGGITRGSSKKAQAEKGEPKRKGRQGEGTHDTFRKRTGRGRIPCRLEKGQDSNGMTDERVAVSAPFSLSTARFPPAHQIILVHALSSWRRSSEPSWQSPRETRATSPLRPSPPSSTRSPNSLPGAFPGHEEIRPCPM